MVVVDQSTSYSIGLAKAFKKQYEKDGGKVLKELKISSGDKDFKAIVSQIGSLNQNIYRTESINQVLKDPELLFTAKITV